MAMFNSDADFSILYMLLTVSKHQQRKADILIHVQLTLPLYFTIGVCKCDGSVSCDKHQIQAEKTLLTFSLD